MGRTLDTLRHGEPQRLVRATPVAPEKPEDCVTDWTLQDEVPFVEVGGPSKNVELSPSLVKHPPQTKTQAPHQPIGTRPPVAAPVASAPGSPLVVNLTEARPMTVAFEPWLGPTSPGAIASEVIAFHQPEHAVSKEYAALLEKMLGAMPATAAQVLLLSGSKPRVGTTTVLLNLAVVAGGQRRRVAVLDMNLARAGLAVRLGHTSPGGLFDVLAGNLALEQAMLPTAVSALSVMALGGAGKKNLQLSAEPVVWLLSWLRQRFDVILIDGPAIEDAADLAILAPCADGMFVVAPHGDSESVARTAPPMVVRMGGRLRGMIHTHF
jgi:Mrp family chromosome partitioning ATPase